MKRWPKKWLKSSLPKNPSPSNIGGRRMAKPDTTLICVGAISGAFGIQGEARIKSFCADPAAIARYAPLSSADGKRLFNLEITRSIPGGYAARLGGIASREDAEALKGTRLYAPRERLPALPDDEFYHSDLIGLEVFDTGGLAVGRIHAIHEFGAGDIIEILGPGLKAAVMLPFTREAVPTVDLASRRIIIDPPEGVWPTEEIQA